MKKLIVFALAISTLLLSGCFGNDTASPVTDNSNQAIIAPVTPLINGDSIAFSDKEYYLRARNSGNGTLCSKIKDSQLKDACETDSKAMVIHLVETDESINLKAHATGKIELCENIQKATLKEQCKKDLQALTNIKS